MPCVGLPIGAVALTVQGSEHCYWLVTNSANQNAARGACQGDGGYLVTIHSQAENDFVRGLVIGAGVAEVWINLSRPTTVQQCNAKGNFTWGTAEPTSPFDGWPTNEPDCSGSGVVMTDDGLWRDRPFTDTYALVCEAGAHYQ